MFKRRQSKQQPSFEDRLSAYIQQSLQDAEALPSGPDRNEILRKAKKAQAAKDMDAWANSRGLQPPK